MSLFDFFGANFHLDSTGHYRRLGNAPSHPGLVAAVPNWSSANPLVDPKDYREFDDTVGPKGDALVPIQDQGESGACNGHTAAELVEYTRMLEGLPHVELSAWWVYAILCDGVDQGSMILDALRLTSATGVCRDELVPHGTIDPRGFTAAMASDARRFRVGVGSRLTTWPEIMSAVQMRRPCNIAVSVGPAFSSLDAEGVPPPNEGGPGNHSVTLVPGAKYSRRWGWLAKAANHWTDRWGQKGFFWVSAHHVNVKYFEAYDVVSTYLDPLDGIAGDFLS